VALTTHSHVAVRLRVSTAIPLLLCPLFYTSHGTLCDYAYFDKGSAEGCV